jgi:leader peptidase (prepilin peptidase) / N-methyltransferase
VTLGAQLETLFAIWLFVVGACIGSFLNVVIARLPRDESLVRPRSKCPSCSTPIAWYDNVPLVSWLVLRGKCRKCGARISFRYFAVELLTGVMFLLALWRFGWTYPLVPALMLVCLLVPLVFIDAEHWILPFEITVPGTVLGVLLAIPNGRAAFDTAALGALIGLLSFRALEYFGFLAFKKEAMGGGDKFLVALIAAFLGWKALLGLIFLSSLQGAVFGLARIALTGRAGPAPQGPAGPVTAPEAPPPVGPDGKPVEEAEDPPATMTWDFARPGLPLWKRLVLLPWSLLFQPIPDAIEDEETGEEEEWVPGASNLPFGPWIGLSALELLFFGQWLAERVPIAGASVLFGAST